MKKSVVGTIAALILALGAAVAGAAPISAAPTSAAAAPSGNIIFYDVWVGHYSTQAKCVEARKPFIREGYQVGVCGKSANGWMFGYNR